MLSQLLEIRNTLLQKGTPKSKVLYFTANRNGEAEVVNIILRKQARQEA